MSKWSGGPGQIPVGTTAGEAKIAQLEATVEHLQGRIAELEADGRCPNCMKLHKDEGEWEHRPHTKHLCVDDRYGKGCRHVWLDEKADLLVRKGHDEAASAAAVRLEHINQGFKALYVRWRRRATVATRWWRAAKRALSDARQAHALDLASLASLVDSSGLSHRPQSETGETDWQRIANGIGMACGRITDLMRRPSWRRWAGCKNGTVWWAQVGCDVFDQLVIGDAIHIECLDNGDLDEDADPVVHNDARCFVYDVKLGTMHFWVSWHVDTPNQVTVEPPWRPSHEQ